MNVAGLGILLILAMLPGPVRHAPAAYGPFGHPVCTVATGPTGDATPLFQTPPGGLPLPTNADDLDLTALGLTSDATTLTAYMHVVKLGNSPAGTPIVYGFGDEWAAEIVGPSATYQMVALYPGTDPSNPGNPTFLLVFKRVPIAAITGQLHFDTNTVTVTAPLRLLSLGSGSTVSSPAAFTIDYLGPDAGLVLPPGSPDPTPTGAPWDPYYPLVTDTVDSGMTSVADYKIGRSC